MSEVSGDMLRYRRERTLWTLGALETSVVRRVIIIRMLKIIGGFDIRSIGAGTRDVFIKSSHFERIPDADAPDGFNACFPMGAKIALDEVIFETGGGATNAAVTFKRFGLKTTCVCSLGQDQNAQDVIQVLKDNRIDTRAVQIKPDFKTAYSIILLAGTGQRSILVYRGAANKLNLKQIPWHKILSRWTYLTSLGGDLKKNRDVIHNTVRLNGKLAWNPGNNELRLGLAKLKPLIQQTHILILNREEGALLAGTVPSNLNKIIKTLKQLPIAALVITDGKNGAYVYDVQNRMFLFSPALSGKRINTTGAGDAFGSGFTAGFIKTRDCSVGLRAGMLNSLGVITHMGAKAGILKQRPTEKQLKKVKIKCLQIKD